MAGIPLRLNGSETSGPNSSNPSLPANTPVYTLKEMTSSEIDDGIVYQILKEFAKTTISSPKTGELTLSDTVGNISTNVIGDYVDTTRVYSVGTKGVQPGGLSATSEITTTVYQVLTAVTETAIIRPLCFRNGNISEMTDTEIMDSIISPALDRMTNRGLGSYHFSSGTPTDTNGSTLPGTWTSIFSVTDRYKSGTVATNSPVVFVNNTIQPPTLSVANYAVNNDSYNESTTYTLYRKTDETAPVSPKRPLKYDNTADRGKHIAEMTNADIIRLVARFRNKIVDTGRGRYAFQSTSPSSGTWGKRGDNIADLLNQMDVGTYTWGFHRTIPKSFIGAYNSAFTGSFTGTYAGPVRTQYFGAFFGGSTAYFTPYYTGTYTRPFLAPFNSTVIKSFITVTILSYTATVVGPTALLQNSDYLWVKRAN